MFKILIFCLSYPYTCSVPSPYHLRINSVPSPIIVKNVNACCIYFQKFQSEQAKFVIRAKKCKKLFGIRAKKCKKLFGIRAKKCNFASIIRVNKCNYEEKCFEPIA